MTPEQKLDLSKVLIEHYEKPNAPKGHKESSIPFEETEWFKKQSIEQQGWLTENAKRVSELCEKLEPDDVLTFKRIQ